MGCYLTREERRISRERAIPGRGRDPGPVRGGKGGGREKADEKRRCNDGQVYGAREMIYGTIVENESRGLKDGQIARLRSYRCLTRGQWVNNTRPRLIMHSNA